MSDEFVDPANIWKWVKWIRKGEDDKSERLVDWLSRFYGISIFVGYLMPNSVLYILNLRFINEYSVDNILDKRDLICLHTIKESKFKVNLYLAVYTRKEICEKFLFVESIDSTV